MTTTSMNMLDLICKSQSDEADMVAEEADVAGNVVGKELKRLVRAGLLIQLNASQGGGTKVMYERVDSSFWGLILSLLEEAHDRQGVADR